MKYLQYHCLFTCYMSHSHVHTSFYCKCPFDHFFSLDNAEESIQCEEVNVPQEVFTSGCSLISHHFAIVCLSPNLPFILRIVL